MTKLLTSNTNDQTLYNANNPTTYKSNTNDQTAK